MQTAPARLAVANYNGLQRDHALFPAVLCSALPPELQDFCGERDVTRC
jgi:hypothetical protein